MAEDFKAPPVYKAPLDNIDSKTMEAAKYLSKKVGARVWMNLTRLIDGKGFMTDKNAKSVFKEQIDKLNNDEKTTGLAKSLHFFGTSGPNLYKNEYKNASRIAVAVIKTQNQNSQLVEAARHLKEQPKVKLQLQDITKKDKEENEAIIVNGHGINFNIDHLKNPLIEGTIKAAFNSTIKGQWETNVMIHVLNAIAKEPNSDKRLQAYEKIFDKKMVDQFRELTKDPRSRNQITMKVVEENPVFFAVMKNKAQEKGQTEYFDFIDQVRESRTIDDPKILKEKCQDIFNNYIKEEVSTGTFGFISTNQSGTTHLNLNKEDVTQFENILNLENPTREQLITGLENIYVALKFGNDAAWPDVVKQSLP